MGADDAAGLAEVVIEAITSTRWIVPEVLLTPVTYFKIPTLGQSAGSHSAKRSPRAISSSNLRENTLGQWHSGTVPLIERQKRSPGFCSASHRSAPFP